MNDNPIVGKFAMAPPVPFMTVLAVVSDGEHGQPASLAMVGVLFVLFVLVFFSLGFVLLTRLACR